MCSVNPSPSRVISLTVATGNRAKPRWQTPTLEAAETLCAARSYSSRLSPHVMQLRRMERPHVRISLGSREQHLARFRHEDRFHIVLPICAPGGPIPPALPLLYP